MTLEVFWTAVLGFVGIVLVGVVSNAAWDMTKVFLRWLWRTTYGVLTGFAQKSRDDIYLRAAYGLQYLAGQLMVAMWFVIMAITAIILSVEILSRLFWADQVERVRLVDIITESDLRFIIFPIALVAVWIGVLLTLRFLLLYIGATFVVQNFERALRQLAPALEEDALKELVRAFAMMQTESEHKAIQLRMRQIGKDSGLSISI